MINSRSRCRMKFAAFHCSLKQCSVCDILVLGYAPSRAHMQSVRQVAAAVAAVAGEASSSSTAALFTWNQRMQPFIVQCLTQFHAHIHCLFIVLTGCCMCECECANVHCVLCIFQFSRVQSKTTASVKIALSIIIASNKEK